MFPPTPATIRHDYFAAIDNGQSRLHCMSPKSAGIRHRIHHEIIAENTTGKWRTHHENLDVFSSFCPESGLVDMPYEMSQIWWYVISRSIDFGRIEMSGFTRLVDAARFGRSILSEQINSPIIDTRNEARSKHYFTYCACAAKLR